MFVIWSEYVRSVLFCAVCVCLERSSLLERIRTTAKSRRATVAACLQRSRTQIQHERSQSCKSTAFARNTW